MARSKYKITAFARFLIFMIFFAPIAYIAASYYNGEDGIGKIKELFQKEENIKNETENSTKNDIQLSDSGSMSDEDQSMLQDEIKLKDLEIKMLKERVERLERELKQKEKFIQAHQH